MMDNCCAPQWADFTRSPQLPTDDYFEIEHDVHGPLIHLKGNLKSNFPLMCKQENVQESTVVENHFDDSLESVESIHSNVAYFIPHDNKEAPLKETNDDRGLHKTMNNLKLDEKSHKIHCTWDVSVSDLTSTTSFKIKVAPPQRIRKSVRMSKSKNIVLGKSLRNNQAMKDVKEKNDAQIALTEDRNESIIKSEVDHCTQYTKANISGKRSSYKMVSVHQRQSDSFKRRRSLGKSQPKVLTCQYRRRSLMKYRRCSNQFISLAEAVSKFQNGTPQRFRTISNKDLKPGPLMKLKRSPLKLTHPVSPALRCKQRTRQTTILSQKERETLELEEMKKHQIKAKPVPVNILKAPAVLKKVAKKPITITEEFRLTQSKKTRHTTGSHVNPPHAVDDKECNTKTAAPIARSISTSNILKKDDKSTEHTTDNTAKSVKNVLPFSFEARNKEFQQKKEEKLKNLQVQEIKKVKAEFHARPVPNFSKSTKPVKEQNVKRRTVAICPFSFAERDKSLAKKKEEHVKHMQEQNKKTHVFHANPVPSFKPVMVHGLPKENLQNKEKPVTGSKDLIPRQTKSCNDQENKQPNIIANRTICPDVKKKEVKQQDPVKKQCKNIATDKSVKVKLEQAKLTQAKFELNTDKRAKERNEFDEKMRKKEQELETKRLEEERNRLAKEKLERAELRKLTEVKARPMPVYKPLVVLKSTKPPTDPHSPACASRSRMKNVS